MSMDLEEQYDKLYRYCFFKVKNREIAEDITQEAFLRFFEKKEYGAGDWSIGYLYTIARNLCIDEFRKKRAEPLNEDVFPDKAMEDDLVSRISVESALSRLDEEDRELLMLKYADELPMSALSRFYGVSRFTLYRRLVRAGRKLKEELKREGL